MSIEFISRRKFNSVVLFVLIASLVACGGKNKQAEPDTAAPTAQIMFPTLVSMTEDSSVLVRGTASDKASAITSVKVNNLETTTSDNYANWQVRVPLALGVNKLIVSTVDGLSNTNANAAEANITSTATLKSSYCMTLANLANIDEGAKIIIAVDTASNSCVALPNNLASAAWQNLSDPYLVVVDKAHNRVLKLASTITAVDLISGAHTPLTTAITASNFPASFGVPQDIAIDVQRNRVLAVTASDVFAIDLSSGDLTLLTESSWSDGDVNLSEASSIIIDSVYNRALIATRLHLFAMDLATAELTLLPGSGTTQPMALDAANNRILALDTYSKVLGTIDLTTGNYSLLSATNLFINPLSVTLDAANNRALVIDYRGTSVVVAVDLTTGSHTFLTPSDYSTPDAVNPFSYPAGVALDFKNNRALIADSALQAIVAVDLTSGKRSIVSSSAVPNAANPFLNPRALVIDSANNRALVADYEQHAVIAVDLTTGARATVSKDWRPTGIYNFYPQAITLDAERNRALILSAAGILAMDLRSGAMSLFSPNSSFVGGMALDGARNRLLQVDLSSKAIIARDLITGVGTVLTQFEPFNIINLLPFPAGIVIDATRNRALVTNLNPGAVVAVDLTTGVSTALESTTPRPYLVNKFVFPWSIAIDGVHNRALVVDADTRSIIVVDVVTGERVIFSK